jgi:hypothetical protein
MKKITSLEEVLVKAFEWTSSAGAGLKETNPQGFIWHVKNMCPLYDNLYPVMVTRAKTQHIRNRDDEHLLAGERSSNNEEDDSERSPDEERAGPAEIEEGNTSTAGGSGNSANVYIVIPFSGGKIINPTSVFDGMIS